MLGFAVGLILLGIIRINTSWECTVVVMFFWLCYVLGNLLSNQKIITVNQQNLEKLIRKEIE